MQNKLFETGGLLPPAITTAPTIMGVGEDQVKKRARKACGKESSHTVAALFDRSYIWMNKLFKLSA